MNKAVFFATLVASLAQPKAGSVQRPFWEESRAWQSYKPKPKTKGNKPKGKGKRGKR